MTKKLFSILRYTSIVALVASLFIMSGCDEDGPVIFAGTQLDFLKTEEFKQATTGSADNSLDSLVKYVSLYPELTAYISGTTQFTLFAPSNTAFKNLLLTPGFPKAIGLISPDIIKNVLAYHFVEGKKLQSDLAAGAKFNSKYTDPASPSAPQIIEVNANGTLKTGSTNADIDIVVANKQSTNGVIHIVESVMIPPSTGATLTPILGTMAGTILLGKDFTYLASMIAKADAGFTEGTALSSRKISTLLAIPSTTAGFPGATFFAPPNAVITAAAGSAGVPAFLNSLNAATSRAILLNHYILGKYVVTSTTGATVFTTATIQNPGIGGKTLTVVVGTPSAQNPFGVTVSSSSTPGATNSYPIVSKDISHTNGFVQVIAGILM